MYKTQNAYYELIKGMAIGVLLMVGACWFWWFFVGNPLDELALIRRAQVTTGHLIDTYETESLRGNRVSVFDRGVYAYRLPDGREFKTTTDALTGQLKELRKVEYLPDKPAISRIEGDGCQTVTEVLWRKIGLGGFLLVGFLSVGFVVARNTIVEFRCMRMIFEIKYEMENSEDLTEKLMHKVVKLDRKIEKSGRHSALIKPFDKIIRELRIRELRQKDKALKKDEQKQ